MGTIERQYTEELYKRYGGYFAAWDPGVKYQLGDYGILKDKTIFERYGNITTDFGVNFEVTELSSPGNLSFCSEGINKVLIDNEATINNLSLPITKTKVGINLSFENEKSMILETFGIKEYGIKNINDLAKKIKEQFTQNNWELDYAIIVSIKKADSETVIITNQEKASIELRAEINTNIIPLDVTTLNIADASLNWGIAQEKNCTYKFVAEGELTPLFKLFGLKKSFLKRKVKAIYFKGTGANRLDVNNKTPLVFKEIKVVF
ncbi:MAG: hypothetical protein LBU51_00300 [Bacteroidales bacterium]|jgi:hypothetical protein|nr:hypothetical protein [Bacteroidales bacterium]